ncbi:monoglyceride lipase-like [Branchiostoma floridae]|uniref:Monoglyceride lipase-like n=1 Tax=Branchiostoma floridae TaxID=7739 RepID=A0A9J7L005_BRAFL|nr:monoglyceride lipase-like [Branchiostoma floridae]
MASETGTDPDRCTPQGVSYSTVPHIVNSDGQYLYCRTWEPNQKLRALLFLSHGRGSHCGVLGPILAQLLNNHGFLVFGHDHVGHGQSEGERLCVENFDILARDILQHVDVMRARYPDVPIFLLGHSMGGCAAIVAACKRPGQFAGMVLTSPAIENAVTCSYSFRALVWVVSKILPNMEQWGLCPDQLTKDNEKLKTYVEDPLVSQGVRTMRIGMKFLYGMLATQSLLPEVDCPFLVLHGGDDEVVDVSGSWKLYHQARSQDKQIKVTLHLG